MATVTTFTSDRLSAIEQATDQASTDASTALVTANDAKSSATASAASALASQQAAENVQTMVAGPTEEVVRTVLDIDLADSTTDVAQGVAGAAKSAISTDLADPTSDISTSVGNVAEAAVEAKTKAEGVPLNELTPVYVGEMQIALLKVMQCAAKDPVTGDWFVAQNDGSTPENTVISRLTHSGAFINAVQLTAGGHGMTCYPQWINGELWVWSGWNDGTTNSMVRFKWRGTAGTTTVIAKTDADIQIMSTFGTDSVLAQIDEQQDRIMYRRSTSSYEMRKLSDVEAGVDDLLYSNVVPTPTGGTFQGWCFVGDTLYIYTGSGTSFSPADPATIWVYDLPSATQLYSINIEGLGMEGNGHYLDDMYEPESLTLYRTPTGKPTIFVGMCVGGGNDRHCKIYAYTQGDTAALGGFAADALVNGLEAEPNWETHPVPTTIGGVAVTSMAQLTRPGWYYFDSATFGTMTDRPVNSTVTGHFLHVSARSAAYAMPTTVQIQELFTNHLPATMNSWCRVVNSSRTPDYWTQRTNTHDTAFAA